MGQPPVVSNANATREQDDDSDISGVLPHDVDISDHSYFEDGAPDAPLYESFDFAEREDADETAAATSEVAPHMNSVPDPATGSTSAPLAAGSPPPTTPTSEVARPPAASPKPPSTYLSLLTDRERAQIAERAYLRGPAPDDPDWLIAYSMQRAVDQLEAAMAVATSRVAQMLVEPREYIVHAEGGGGKLEDLAEIRRHLAAIDERLAAFPYRSSATVERLTEPFAQLAEASASLVTGIDKTRVAATAAIMENAKTARQQMLRTAFEGHALPASRATRYHVVEIALLVALICAVLVASFHGDIVHAVAR